MGYSTLDWQVDDGLLRLTLNRPDRLNAFDVVMANELVDAFVRCLGGKGDGRRLNIGSGAGTTVRRLHTLVAKAVGAPDAPEFAPARPGELAAITLDVGQARRALGWEPVVGLEQGLASCPT